jgi:hypothetical protein
MTLSIPRVVEKMTHLLAHMVEEHQLHIPPYIHEFMCGIPQCNYATVSASLIEMHKSSAHSEAQVVTLRTRDNAVMHYSEYKCFECTEDQEEVYVSMDELATHFLTHHTVVSGRTFIVSCKSCDKKFQRALNLKSSVTFVSEVLASYLTHLVKKHFHPVPSYVKKFECSQEDCDFFTFNSQYFSSHLKKMHTSEKEKDSLRPKDLVFSQFFCFLCPFEKEFGSKHDLFLHVVQTHFQESPKGPVMMCPHCYKSLNMGKKARNMRQVFIDFGIMMLHLIEKHNFEIPSYISSFACSQEGCHFVTVTQDRLATHLKKQHGIIDEKLSSCKPKCFLATNRSKKNLTSKLIMKMTKYFCFLCGNEKEYQTVVEYAQHWRDHHLVQCGDVFELRCMSCAQVYKIPWKKALECSAVFERASNLFMHMINHHCMAPPDYVVPFRCEVPTCDYVAYTLYKLEAHCKTFHGTTHSALVQAAEQHKSSTQGHIQMPSLFDALMPTESAFMCFKCGASFPNLEAKETHMNEVHDSEPKYLCHVCSEGFRCDESHKNHLFKVHQIVSEGLEALFCDKCDYSTVLRDKFVSHMFNAHGIVVQIS